MAKKRAPTTAKKGLKQANILGVKVTGTNKARLLREILARIESQEKTFIVTPNPEFVVKANDDPAFRKLLNSADMAIPDGIGLVWAGRWLGQAVSKRFTGVDLAQELLELASQKNFRVGVVGARRGVKDEEQALIRKLQKKFSPAVIESLGENKNWRQQRWEIIFACQGMGEQERWIKKNIAGSKAIVFVGVGGGLDFIAGLVPRAPVWVRHLGMEWLYRLLRQPWRIKRQLNLLTFIGLIIQEKLGIRQG